MKKTNIFIISVLFLLILLSGCYDPVFYEVNKDVRPEDATVSGIINSVTRYSVGEKEYLILTADGGVRYKLTNNELHGSWKTINEFPFQTHSYDYFSFTHNGQQIIKVVADSENLYLITAAYADDDVRGTVCVSKISVWANNNFTIADDNESLNTTKDSWKCILEDSTGTYFPMYFYLDYQYSAFAVFQTNAPQKANRKAYVRSGNIYSKDSHYTTVKHYELSMDGLKEISVTTADSENSNASSAVFFNGDYVFFNSIAATTNETYEKAATRAYYGNGKYLYYSDADNSTKFIEALNVGNTISAIATCSDSILIGRATYSDNNTSSYGGIVKTTLTDGVPGNSLINFDTNAEFQLSSSYLINTIINATPDKSEKQSSLYASISYYGTGTSANVNYKNIGLWSYYSSRGNWNRE